MMQYTPSDILNYVYEKEGVRHKKIMRYSSLPQDKIFTWNEAGRFHKGQYIYLISEAYHLDIKITDDEVMTAAINGLYISAFISRKDDNYRVHFLVHQYPDQMKARFEEEITKDVVDYMIYGTIMALRLDTPEKVNAYLGI